MRYRYRCQCPPPERAGRVYFGVFFITLFRLRAWWDRERQTCRRVAPHRSRLGTRSTSSLHGARDAPASAVAPAARTRQIPVPAPAGAVACRGLTTLSLDTPPLTVASAPRRSIAVSSRPALELPPPRLVRRRCAERCRVHTCARDDSACRPPRRRALDAAIMAANFNAVCFFSELTKVPHILEPSTTSSDRTGDEPTREPLESKVLMSTPALTDSASQSLGAGYRHNRRCGSTARTRARGMCNVSALSAPPPRPPN